VRFVNNITNGSISPISISVRYPIGTKVFIGYVNYYPNPLYHFLPNEVYVEGFSYPISIIEEPQNSRIGFTLESMPAVNGSQTISIRGIANRNQGTTTTTTTRARTTTRNPFTRTTTTPRPRR
jgi:hypothetical protein